MSAVDFVAIGLTFVVALLAVTAWGGTFDD